MKIKIRLFIYALFIAQSCIAMEQEDGADFTKELKSIPLKMTYTKITDELYQAYSPSGTLLDLPDMIATISIFSKNADDQYVFIKNNEYSLPHENGVMDNVEAIKNTVLSKSTPAAICIAFEMVSEAHMMGGTIRPRKRISKLDHFIFDFGQNISPEAIDLRIMPQYQQKIDITMSVKINGETRFISPRFYLNHENILSNSNAAIIYELSSTNSTGYMNVYWQSALNSCMADKECS